MRLACYSKVANLFGPFKTFLASFCPFLCLSETSEKKNHDSGSLTYSCHTQRWCIWELYLENKDSRTHLVIKGEKPSRRHGEPAATCSQHRSSNSNYMYLQKWYLYMYIYTCTHIHISLHLVTPSDLRIVLAHFSPFMYMILFSR